ncbi:UNKNOWN [Stylonychia lemnae]|uniref:Uncharacterized protein n=1 Tax=Stylonychia lemnae TaxID=5949 RepID=A0A078BA48_STYLE|nr:UNKNOWN [Stylonychia lemnae]|eukprot:CDW91121.1 UNKNOWN [Stylonychia lemnae]
MMQSTSNSLYAHQAQLGYGYYQPKPVQWQQPYSNQYGQNKRHGQNHKSKTNSFCPSPQPNDFEAAIYHKPKQQFNGYNNQSNDFDDEQNNRHKQFKQTKNNGKRNNSRKGAMINGGAVGENCTQKQSVYIVKQQRKTSIMSQSGEQCLPNTTAIFSQHQNENNSLKQNYQGSKKEIGVRHSNNILSSEEESSNSNNSPLDLKDHVQDLRNLAEKLKVQNLFPIQLPHQKFLESHSIPYSATCTQQNILNHGKQFQDLTPVKTNGLNENGLLVSHLKSIKNQLKLDQSSEDSTFPSDSAKSENESNKNLNQSQNLLFKATEIISSPNADEIVETKNNQVSAFNNPETTMVNHNQVIAQLFGLGSFASSSANALENDNNCQLITSIVGSVNSSSSNNQRWSNLQTKYYEKPKCFMAPKTSEIPLPL